VIPFGHQSIQFFFSRLSRISLAVRLPGAEGRYLGYGIPKLWSVAPGHDFVQKNDFVLPFPDGDMKVLMRRIFRRGFSQFVGSVLAIKLGAAL
jgi:hypothetical protein